MQGRWLLASEVLSDSIMSSLGIGKEQTHMGTELFQVSQEVLCMDDNLIFLRTHHTF